MYIAVIIALLTGPSGGTKGTAYPSNAKGWPPCPVLRLITCLVVSMLKTLPLQVVAPLF